MISSVASKQGVGIDDVTIYAEVQSVNRIDGVTERVSLNADFDITEQKVVKESCRKASVVA